MDIKNIDFLFSENPNPMWIYDPSDLSIKAGNKAACDLYGYSENELVSITIADLRPASEKAKLEEYLETPAKDFNNAGIWKHKKKSGDILFVRVLSNPIRYNEKQYKLVTVHDVTNEIQYKQELHQLVENSLDGIMLTSPDGKIYRANRSACEILGMEEQEIIKRGREGITYEGQKLRKAINRRSQSGNFSGELTFIHKSGRKIPVELTTSVYTNLQGEQRTSLVFRDITQRKETQQKLRDILEHSTNMFYRHDTNNTVTYVSPQAKEFLGVTPGKVQHQWTDFITENPDNQKGYEYTQKAITTGQAQPSYPLELQKTNGEKIWVRVNEAPIVENGKPVAMVGSLTDITEQRQYEEQLQESLKRYHYVTKATNDGIYDWNIIDDHLHLGEGFYDIIGEEIDLQSCTLEEYAQLVHPADHPTVQQDLNEALAHPSKNHWEHEYRFKKSDGGYAHVIENGYIIRDDDGAAIRMIGAIRDVTEQRKLEDLLEEAQRMAGIGAWEVDLISDEIYWSSITREIHQVDSDYTPDLETSISFYKEGKHRKTIQRIVQEAIEDGISSDIEALLITAKGNERWVRVKAEPEIIQGECVRLYGSFQDIHDRKVSQLKLQQAYKERQQILERINDAFYAVDRDWTVTYWNKQAEETLGPSQSEMIGENLWEKFPAAKELKFYPNYQQALNDQTSVQFEEFFHPLKQWFEVSAYPSPDGLSVFFRDITGRKETEESLREVYRRKRLILESTEEGIYGIDTEGRCTLINASAVKMLGYSTEECIGKNMHDLIHHTHKTGEPYPESGCPIFVAKNQHESCRIADEVFWRADNSCFEVEYTSNPMIEDGKIKGAVIVFSDITERKQKQEEIRQAKERYDIASKATSDTIWDLDLQNDTIEYNSNIYNMFGYKTQQVNQVGDWWRDKIHPEDRPVVLAQIEGALKTNSDRFQMEYRFQAADDSYKYIYDRAFIVKDENSEALRMIGAMQDITDRKKAELELIESFQEKEMLLQEIHHRVKNNLAIVTSMMQLQAMETENPDLQGALQSAQQRIQTIANIHELLYGSESLSHLNFGENIRQLLHNLREIYDNGKQIAVDLHVDDIPLNINQAIPCALMVNEVVTNAYKHAFNHQKEGRITVHLHEADGNVKVEITDNGVGIPTNLAQEDLPTIGMTLITLLKQQLEGEISFSNTNGTQFSLEFKKADMKGIGSSLIEN
ncbi:PAS domain S-box protein [Fodinibius sp. AD559]|uniref:PAS domain S-box protein n=1 Tax=Fodinibius sp. AD559 TaxID=3424179 RepID=UPI0040469449